MLTAQEKENWQTQEANNKSAGKPLPALPSLGDKLALSLKKISEHAKTEQSQKKSRVKLATAILASEQEPTSAFVPQKMPSSILTSVSQEASQTIGAKKKTVTSESKAQDGLGTLWGKKEVAAPLPTTDTPHSDDSLKKVFSRLEPVEAQSKPPAAEKRPSYLGRLGRK